MGGVLVSNTVDASPLGGLRVVNWKASKSLTFLSAPVKPLPFPGALDHAGCHAARSPEVTCRRTALRAGDALSRHAQATRIPRGQGVIKRNGWPPSAGQLEPFAKAMLHK